MNKEYWNIVKGIGIVAVVVTLWFVPVSVASACLLGAIVTLSRKAKRNGIKYGFQAIAIAALSTIGYYLEKKEVGLAAYLEVHYYSGPLPNAFPNLWPIYLVLGLGIPLGVSLLLVNFKRK